MTEDWISGPGTVSSMARMVETLNIRGYPSLQLDTRILPGEPHDTVSLTYFARVPGRCRGPARS